MREMRMHNLSTGGRVILKWTLQKNCVRVWTGLNCLRICFSEHGNEPLHTTKGREVLDQLSDYHLLKRVSAP
jgi:hypothetical protein